jgi:hypothetical protein
LQICARSTTPWGFWKAGEPFFLRVSIVEQKSKGGELGAQLQSPPYNFLEPKYCWSGINPWSLPLTSESRDHGDWTWRNSNEWWVGVIRVVLAKNVLI